MDGGFACTWVEDNALQSLAVEMARAGVSCFSPMPGEGAAYFTCHGRWSTRNFFWGLPCMDGGFACTWVEDNALQSLAVVTARARVSCFFTDVKRRGYLLHLPRQVKLLETFLKLEIFLGIAMHGRWLRLYVSHTWRIMHCNPWRWWWRELGSLPFTMDMGVFYFTGHGRANRKWSRTPLRITTCKHSNLFRH